MGVRAYLDPLVRGGVARRGQQAALGQGRQPVGGGRLLLEVDDVRVDGAADQLAELDRTAFYTRSAQSAIIACMHSPGRNGGRAGRRWRQASFPWTN